MFHAPISMRTVEQEASAGLEAVRCSPVSPTSGEEVLRRRLLEILSAPTDRRKMTYEEFLAWADEDTTAEWIDGEVVMCSPASRRHQEIGLFLGQVVGLYVEHRGMGRILVPPFQMKLADSGREPDLLFVASEHLGRLTETYLEGPADLVVEIVSPESMGRDRGEKFYEYEQAGVPEYWLIDPQTQRVEFYRLTEDGQYRLVLPDAEGIYRSDVLPGFWLRVEWLWQEPLPDPLRVLGQIAGMDSEVIDGFVRALEGQT